MLDFIGIIVLVAAIIVSINALTGAIPVSPSQRIALSVGAGLWTGLAAALAGADLFLGSKAVGPVLIVTVIASPLVAAAIAASLSASVRALLLEMPMPFLIGLNVWRIGGGFFLLLAGLPGHFRIRRGGAISSPARSRCRWPGSRCADKARRWSGAGMRSGCSISSPRLRSESPRRMARRCRSSTLALARRAYRCCLGL